MLRGIALGILLVASGWASRAAADALADKAASFQRALRERHLAPEGFILYRVDLRSIERQRIDGDYPDLADAPMFAGIWAGSACAHAAASSGAERSSALRDADDALRGMEFLMNVTGVRGLLSRSARRGRPPERGRKKWLPGGPGFEAYWWRGDVSMDQYANGLVTAVGLCGELFPQRARRLAVDAAHHLHEHDMQLTDPDGQRTRYGDLSPGSGLGFNSIAKLTGWAVFALAAELDGDPRWRARRDQLRDRDRVVARSKTTNLRVLGITNFSNDLMAWNLYRSLVPLARRSEDPALEDLREGVERTWRRTRRYGNAYFDMVFCRLEPEQCEPERIEAARDLLSAFPLDKRKLERPGLEDIRRRLLPGRKFRREARDPVPIQLRPVSSFEWKSSPYRVRQRIGPHTEYTGLDYLVAYWLYLDVSRALESRRNRRP